MAKSIKKKTHRRNRAVVNLTLSPFAREAGQALAELRGIKFSQLVELMLREELRAAGKLPPEDAK